MSGVLLDRVAAFLDSSPAGHASVLAVHGRRQRIEYSRSQTTMNLQVHDTVVAKTHDSGSSKVATISGAVPPALLTPMLADALAVHDPAGIASREQGPLVGHPALAPAECEAPEFFRGTLKSLLETSLPANVECHSLTISETIHETAYRSVAGTNYDTSRRWYTVTGVLLRRDLSPQLSRHVVYGRYAVGEEILTGDALHSAASLASVAGMASRPANPAGLVFLPSATAQILERLGDLLTNHYGHFASTRRLSLGTTVGPTWLGVYDSMPPPREGSVVGDDEGVRLRTTPLIKRGVVQGAITHQAAVVPMSELGGNGFYSQRSGEIEPKARSLVLEPSSPFGVPTRLPSTVYVHGFLETRTRKLEMSAEGTVRFRASLQPTLGDPHMFFVAQVRTSLTRLLANVLHVEDDAVPTPNSAQALGSTVHLGGGAVTFL
ncbi:metallopeptidase TldD-related protein [Longispora sp. K20-0274]|uniref:metallopeptidase TldD-related protein n=1 Tax=Longispora sp. K20-0274 TaxID=3088255 RepID=UPI00399BD530